MRVFFSLPQQQKCQLDFDVENVDIYCVLNDGSIRFVIVGLFCVSFFYSFVLFLHTHALIGWRRERKNRGKQMNAI